MAITDGFYSIIKKVENISTFLDKKKLVKGGWLPLVAFSLLLKELR